jgi:drug/metabolite transporter (DMT)-like permease
LDAEHEYKAFWLQTVIGAPAAGFLQNSVFAAHPFRWTRQKLLQLGASAYWPLHLECMERYAPFLAGITYSAIFGFSFIASKEALKSLLPFEMLFLRFALATLIVLLLAALRVIRVSYRGKPISRLAFVCLLEPIIYFVCETFGIKECSTSTAGLVLGAIPVTVTFLAWPILSEKPTWTRVLSLLVSLCGVGLIAFNMSGGENTPFGFLMLFGAMASASLYNVFSRKSSRHFTPMETTFAMMVSGTATFGLLAFFCGRPNIAQRIVPALPSIAYLGGLSSVVAFFLVNFNLSRLRASQSSVFSNLSTAISVAAGVIFLGERFGPPQVIGGILILIGVWGANRNGRFRSKSSSAVPRPVRQDHLAQQDTGA